MSAPPVPPDDDGGGWKQAPTSKSTIRRQAQAEMAARDSQGGYGRRGRAPQRGSPGRYGWDRSSSAESRGRSTPGSYQSTYRPPARYSGQSTPGSTSSANENLSLRGRALSAPGSRSYTPGGSQPPHGAPGTRSGQSTPASTSRGDHQRVPSGHGQVVEPLGVGTLHDPFPDEEPERDPETMRALATRMCRNVLLRKEVHTADIRQIEENIGLYLQSGSSNAILPARPKENNRTNAYFERDPPTVFANHFKVRFNYDRNSPAPTYLLYSVTWGQLEQNSQGNVKLQPVRGGQVKQERWWNQIVEEHGKDANGMNNVQSMYDGASLLVSTEPFNFEARRLRTEGVKYRFTSEGQPNEMEVTIQSKESLDLDECENFINNARRTDFPQVVIQTLNKVMKQHCTTSKYSKSGRFYFHKGDKGRDLDRNLLSFKLGYFQSVRALRGSLTLNVDVTSTAFYKPDVELTRAWETMRTSYLEPGNGQEAFRRWRTDSWWNEEQVDIVNAWWNNLRIQSTHRRGEPARFYTTYEFSTISADQTTIPLLYSEGEAAFPRETTCNLSAFMNKVHGMDVRNQKANFPAIKVSKDKPYYLPWGCCKTTSDTRYGGKVKGSFLRLLATNVGERYEGVENWVKERYVNVSAVDNRPDGEKYLDVTVEPTMMEVEAQTLVGPQMEGHGRERLVRTADGSFIFGQQHQMFEPATVVRWALLEFNEEAIDKGLYNRFYSTLFVEANKRGLVWLKWEPVERWNHNTTMGRTEEGRREDIKNKLWSMFVEDRPNKEEGGPLPEFMICVMPDKLTPEYATLKFECDKTYGVQTQVVVLKGDDMTDSKMTKFVTNLLFKINAKCGGVNFRVAPTFMNTIKIMKKESKTMLVGADVTHPGGGDKRSPSMAAVVATTDVDALRYACRITPQGNGVENIGAMETMFAELLRVWVQKAGSLPNNILFFRDGISESQYTKCLCYEGTAILRAAETVRPGYKPKLFIILAIKRHRTRFFMKEEGEITNITQGTVVYGGVTHPREYDFFLLSHAPDKIKTSRATRYYVLLDQVKLYPSDLYRLIYYLCHTYQRCNNVVSLVTPVNYAHVAATRARLYLGHFLALHTDADGHLTVDPMIQDFNAHESLKNQLWFL